MGAVQAQDYNAALWAIGLRMSTKGRSASGGGSNITVSDIERAIAKREIIRLWPMRGTIHFVSAEDARWMHQLLTPRLNNTYSERSNRLGITPAIIKKSKELFTKALKGGKQLTRDKLYGILDKAGIKTANSIGLHIVYRMAHEGLMVCGPREGKQQTFVLFNEWVPVGNKFSREEGLKELARRYFTSHGPAQVQDLMWWSGLTAKDVRAGIEANGSKLVSEKIESKTYYFNNRALRPAGLSATRTAFLLPAFDEYVVAYRDRDAVLESIHKEKINPGANGVLSSVVVINGQIVGNWRREFKKKEVVITTQPFAKFTSAENKLIEMASERYKKFVGK